MQKMTSLFLMCLLYHIGYAQVYQDHFGTGNTVGVTVTTSSNQGTDIGAGSLTGTDWVPDLEGASRFLSQASLGYNYEDVEYVAQIGIEDWIEEQMALPVSSYLTTYQDIYNAALTKVYAVHGSNTDSTRRRDFMSYTFYEKAFKEQDVLRQKVAFALSQILVISTQNTNLDDRGFGVADYYDLLYQGAFSNFHDLLRNVTLHPTMGIYLSHFKNRKANPIEGTLPDENFAREIMQLFTIGLFELNNDGTLKLDLDGNPIPTYDIVDIQELAKVFTGLSGGDWDLILRPQNAGTPVTFNKGFPHYDLTVPMAMYEDEHEPSAKTMIDGSIIPANQLGMQDIDMALNVLFNHDNVGPFIGKRLIQQLVKSNPTPSYINRVAMVFNDNGQGVRGDLEAVVKTILTDPEARECTWIESVQTGRLRQPVERLTHLFAAFDIASPSTNLWFRDMNLIYEVVEQAFLFSPTVFNFFTPFYAEGTYVEPNDMVSPEFQILHATSAIHSINLVEEAIKIRPFKNRTAVNPNNPVLTNDNTNDEPYFDFTDEINIYDTQGLNALIDRLDILLCHGQLTDGTKAIIADAVTQYIANDSGFTSQEVVNDVLYFILMSPDYIVLK